METRNLPRVGELVIANITKITRFGAYCRLPEYNDLEVFLPIREVSSGWIKNIREFIHEGQKLVCEVIFYDKDKGTIDISLKRVTASKSKERIRAYNLEKRLAALFAQTVKNLKTTQNKDALIQEALAEFKNYTNLVYHTTNNTEEFNNSKLPKSLKDSLLKVLEANRKQKRYIVAYIMKLATYNTLSGATELREILGSIKNIGIDVKYIGAPRYRLVSEAEDYAKAEEKIKKVEPFVREKLSRGIFEIEKEKLKKVKEDIMSTI